MARSASFGEEYIEGSRRSVTVHSGREPLLPEHESPSDSEDTESEEIPDFIEYPRLESRTKVPSWKKSWRAIRRQLIRAWKVWFVVLIGVAVKCIPTPDAITPKAWTLMAIFTATILAILIQALPTGSAAFLGLCTTIVTRTLTFDQAFSEFATEGPWVVATSIFLAGGINSTGLGKRLSCVLVSWFGSSTLGLTYSLVASEFLLAPAIPSVAARAGGILLPICKSLAEACGSSVGDGTERELGAYLLVTIYQTSTITSSIFLTASSANPLSRSLGSKLADHEITWLRWASGGIVPGLVDIAVIPLVLWFVYPPKLKKTEEARALARAEMRALGPMRREEWVMLGALITTVALWVLGSILDINLVAAAGIGLAIVFLTDVITWNDCISNQVAWDAFTWIAALASMAAELNSLGVLKLFSDVVSRLIESAHCGAWLAVTILTVLYVYAHYFFAGAVSQVAALYQSFVQIAISTGVPPLLSALIFAYNSNILGSLTHYSQSHSPMFYSQGYVPLNTFLGLGLLISVVNIVVWLGVGALWWKILELY